MHRRQPTDYRGCSPVAAAVRGAEIVKLPLIPRIAPRVGGEGERRIAFFPVHGDGPTRVSDVVLGVAVPPLRCGVLHVAHDILELRIGCRRARASTQSIELPLVRRRCPRAIMPPANSTNTAMLNRHPFALRMGRDCSLYCSDWVTRAAPTRCATPPAHPTSQSSGCAGAASRFRVYNRL